MVLAGVGDARAEDVGVHVDAADDGEQEREELGVRVRVVARVEEVLPVVGRHRPVVVLARPVDAGERLLVDQEHEAVLRRELPHHRHDDHVVVRARPTSARTPAPSRTAPARPRCGGSWPGCRGATARGRDPS